MPRKRKSTSAPKRSRTQRGRGITDVFRTIASAAPKIHSFVKSNKLISRGLALTPYKGAAAVASQLGYGKRRKRSTARVTKKRSSTMAPRKSSTRRSGISSRRVILSSPVQVGSGLFGDLGSGIGSIARGLFG